MKIRFLKLLALFVVLCSLALPACRTGGQVDAAVLEFWGGWTGPDGEVMQKIVDQWNAEKHGMTVRLTRQAWSPQFDAFLVASSARQAPDLMALRTHEEAQFVVQGLLSPLDVVVAESEVLQPASYLPQFIQFNTYQGHQYGIPLDVHMHGLYYNLDLFKKAGLEKPPATAAEFLETARLLTLDAGGLHPGEQGFDAAHIVQYGVNQFTNHHIYFQFQSLLQQQKGQIVSDDGESCALDIEKGARALQWQADLVYRYGVAPQGQTDSIGDFLAGRTAMLIDGPWQMPALEKAQQDRNFHWAAAPYPAIFSDQPAVWGSSHALVLPAYANPVKRPAAIRFLEWLAIHSAAWADSGQLPVYTAVMNSPRFQNRYGRAAFISMIPYVKTLPNIPEFNEIFATNSPTPMMVMGQSVVLEQADPRTAVRKVCAEIDGILAVP